MAGAKRGVGASVSISVELFDQARLLTGRREIKIAVPEHAGVAELTIALAAVCPELVGPVLLEDRSGLREGYIFNLNGTTFVSDQRLHLKTGDGLLLFSSQAGG